MIDCYDAGKQTVFYIILDLKAGPYLWIFLQNAQKLKNSLK